jgi:hypothetical protein
VFQWVQRFKSSRTSSANKDYLGHPTTSQMDGSTEKLMLSFNRTHRLLSLIQVRWEDGHQMWISYFFIHKNLGHHKICTRWVPKQFKEELNWAHVEMCIQFLLISWRRDFSVVSIMGNETSVYHYELLANFKKWSGNTHRRSGSRNSKVCLLPAERCSQFWDINGPILEHYQYCIKAWYCDKPEVDF